MMKHPKNKAEGSGLLRASQLSEARPANRMTAEELWFPQQSRAFGFIGVSESLEKDET